MLASSTAAELYARRRYIPPTYVAIDVRQLQLLFYFLKLMLKSNMNKRFKDQNGFGVAVLLAGLVVVTLIGVASYMVYAKHHTTTITPAQNTTIFKPKTSSINAANPDCPIKNLSNVALGASALGDSFSIKLLRVIDNPSTSGDKPDPGTRYLEADFLISTLADHNNYALNINFIPSTAPTDGAGCGYQTSPIDTPGGAYNPITYKRTLDKVVKIPGKQSINAGFIPKNGQAKTVEVYALYEIQESGKGQIVWDTFQDKSYSFEF
jgi:hypothetical protein